MVKSEQQILSTLLDLLHFHGSPDSCLASLSLFIITCQPFQIFLLVALVAESDWLGRSGKGDDAQYLFKIHSPALDSSTGIGQGRIL
jgi:hypothetical protein